MPPTFIVRSQCLEALGPIIDVEVMRTRILVDALRYRGESVPPPICVRALIDTGAQGTVVSPRIVEQLDIHPFENTPMRTANQLVPPMVDGFKVSLTITDSPTNRFTFDEVTVYAATLGGQPFEMLIGRNILRSCQLTYDGNYDQFSLRC